MRHILLKNLLRESTRVDLKTIAAACPVSLEALQKQRITYRGTRRQDSYVRYDASGFFRKSKDSNNFSLMYTDGLKSWEEANIPKRTNSVIFTRDAYTAAEYGTAYGIFLEGNPDVAFGNAGDNYNNYTNGLRKSGLGHGGDRVVASSEMLDSVMSALQRVYLPDLPGDFLDNTKSSEEVYKFVHDLNSAIHGDIELSSKSANIWIPASTYHALPIFRKNGIAETLNVVFDPWLNEITVVPLDEYMASDSSGAKHAEAWSSAAYYLIPGDDLEQLNFH